MREAGIAIQLLELCESQLLLWSRREFVEYDVETDPDARQRLRAFGADARTVPLLVEAGAIVQIGWQGRGCVITLERRGS